MGLRERQWLPSRAILWTLGLVILLALVLDFVYYTGFYASDDIGYFNGTGWFAGDSGDGRLLLTGDIRIGVTLPNALPYWISGGDIGYIAWFNILYHVGLVIVAFCLGTVIKDERTGLIAAFLAAGNPIYYLFAGALYPDNATALWLGILLLSLEIVRRRPAMPIQKTFRWYFAMGALLGIGYTCKETSLIMTVPTAICIIAAAPRLWSVSWIRSGAFVIAGLLSVMLIEVLVLRLITGEWIWRLGILQSIVGDAFEAKMRWQGTTPVERFEFAATRKLIPFVPISMWVFLAASISLILTRGRNLALLLFFWWPLLYLTIGSTSFTSYRPSSIQTRYYSLVVLPAAVMTAIFVSLAMERWLSAKRLPGWAKSRRLVLTCVTMAGLVLVWREAAANVVHSGNMYKNGVVRGFVAAYEKARTDYPQYDILLSNEYRKKMTVLLVPDVPKHVFAAEYLTGPIAPRPPYIYLEAVENIAAGSSGSFSDSNGEPLEVRTLHTIDPPATRAEALLHKLRGAFSIRPRPVLSPPIRGSALIQLVTRRDQVHPGQGSKRPPLSVFGKKERARIRVKEANDGYFVIWQDPERIAFQIPDAKSYKRAPKHPLVQLDSPTRKLAVDVDLQLTRGAPVTVHVTLYGYTEGNDHVKEWSPAELSVGADATTVHVEVSAEEPMRAYKLRMSMRQEGAHSGVLHVGDHRIVVTE